MLTVPTALVPALDAPMRELDELTPMVVDAPFMIDQISDVDSGKVVLLEDNWTPANTWTATRTRGVDVLAR